MSIELTWLGHSSWWIKTGEYKILIDPFIGDNPAANVPSTSLEPTHILVSHGHFDHIADAAEIANRSKAVVITNYEIATWLETKHGVANTVSMNLGGKARMPFGTVQFTPAVHSSMLPDGSYGGACGGFLLHLDRISDASASSQSNTPTATSIPTASEVPVNKNESPALDLDYLKASYHLLIKHIELKQVARQQDASGILKNATHLRECIESFNGEFPKISLHKDVVRLSGEDLEDALNSAYSNYGYNDVLIVTRSNKRANLFNQAVRGRVRYMEEDLCSGDLMMVVKNNYFWLDEKSEAGFIANGDSLEIKKIIRRKEMYGFNFAECVVKLCDYENMPEISLTLLLDSIYTEVPSLTKEQQQQLYANIMEDVNDEPIKGVRMNYLRKSPYFNALQVKFNYAVTCHKAQGGQWPCVFIDQGYLTKEMLNKEYIRWLYTAFTRATDKVYLMNFSDDFFE